MTGQQHNLLDMVKNNDKFSILTKALTTAGLAEMLEGDKSLTLFAPTNEAFDKLPQDKLNELMKPENKERLTNILKFHIVPDKFMTGDAREVKTPKTLQSQELKITPVDGGSVKVNEAKADVPGIPASNGIIYTIDKVLMPQVAAAAR